MPPSRTISHAELALAARHAALPKAPLVSGYQNIAPPQSVSLMTRAYTPVAVSTPGNLHLPVLNSSLLLLSLTFVIFHVNSSSQPCISVVRAYLARYELTPRIWCSLAISQAKSPQPLCRAAFFSKTRRLSSRSSNPCGAAIVHALTRRRANVATSTRKLVKEMMDPGSGSSNLPMWHPNILRALICPHIEVLQ